MQTAAVWSRISRLCTCCTTERQRQTACSVIQMVNSRDTTDAQPPASVAVDVGCVSLRWCWTSCSIVTQITHIQWTRQPEHTSCLHRKPGNIRFEMKHFSFFMNALVRFFPSEKTVTEIPAQTGCFRLATPTERGELPEYSCSIKSHFPREHNGEVYLTLGRSRSPKDL